VIWIFAALSQSAMVPEVNVTSNIDSAVENTKLPGSRVIGAPRTLKTKPLRVTPLNCRLERQPAAGYRLYLDYLLVSNRHLQPVNGIIETLIPHSPRLLGDDYDLSDHFPVFGHFVFPSFAPDIAAFEG